MPISDNRPGAISSPAGVVTINGLSGDVTITKNTVGLSQVDNTSDLNKPISTAVAAELLTKANYNKITVVDPITNTSLTYSTLQDAFNAIPAATTNLEARHVYIVFVPSGTYDEDVVVQLNNRRILMVCLGSVALGTLTGSSWGAGGVARNFTLSTLGAPATVNSIRSSFAVTSSAALSEGFTSHQSYIGKFRVSGNLVISSTIGISTEVYAEIEVFGNIDASGYSGNLNLYLKNSRVRGTVSGAILMQEAVNTSFAGLVSVNRLSFAQNSAFAGGLSVASASSDQIVNGFYNCSISGVFTGPAASARFDGSTNYLFNANGATLAGGATKVIRELIPASAVEGLGTTEIQVDCLDNATENIVIGTQDTKYVIDFMLKSNVSSKKITGTIVLGYDGSLIFDEERQFSGVDLPVTITPFNSGGNVGIDVALAALGENTKLRYTKKVISQIV